MCSPLLDTSEGTLADSSAAYLLDRSIDAISYTARVSCTSEATLCHVQLNTCVMVIVFAYGHALILWDCRQMEPMNAIMECIPYELQEYFNLPPPGTVLLPLLGVDAAELVQTKTLKRGAALHVRCSRKLERLDAVLRIYWSRLQFSHAPPCSERDGLSSMFCFLSARHHSYRCEAKLKFQALLMLFVTRSTERSDGLCIRR